MKEDLDILDYIEVVEITSRMDNQLLEQIKRRVSTNFSTPVAQALSLGLVLFFVLNGLIIGNLMLIQSEKKDLVQQMRLYKTNDFYE